MCDQPTILRYKGQMSHACNVSWAKGPGRLPSVFTHNCWLLILVFQYTLLPHGFNLHIFPTTVWMRIGLEVEKERPWQKPLQTTRHYEN